MSAKTILDNPQTADSGDYKKVVKGIKDIELRNKVIELLRNNSREVYLRRLQKCGVIFKWK